MYIRNCYKNENIKQKLFCRLSSYKSQGRMDSLRYKTKMFLLKKTQRYTKPQTKNVREGNRP